MTKEVIQPVKDKDGKPIPGLFAFDKLERNNIVEHGINIHILESERLKTLQKIDASQRKSA